MLDTASLFSKVESHALSLGLFERVNTSEPKNAPGHGLTAAIWVQVIEPVQSSGLAATSGRVEFNLRIYTNMLSEPQDAIDPNMTAAVDTLMDAYSGDFDLGATVRNIDLLGAHGTALRAQAGYINQDGKLYRVMTVTLPVIINDIWNQEA